MIFLRFLVAGGCGWVVGYLVLLLFHTLFDLNPYLTYIPVMLSGALVNYNINKFWVWRGYGKHLQTDN